jgi:tetratricopeptide (TPR) repeat protein
VRYLVALLVVAGLPGLAVAQPSARFSFGITAHDDVGRRDLFDAALVAGGTTDAGRRAYYRGQFDAAVAELQTSGRVVGTAIDRARAVHEFLHSRWLRTFHETATTLDAAFDAGRFNCISSVILFRCLATKFGLQAHGVEVPGHAYAVVDTEMGALVVQTTCPAWFAVLGDDAMRRAALRQTLGEAATGADRAPTEGRRLDDVGLTAIVYYNRGLDHLEAGRFAESLAANRSALELDAHNSAARANLLATLNNWSLDRYRQGDVAQALSLLEQGLAIDPNYALFRENLAAIRSRTPR